MVDLKTIITENVNGFKMLIEKQKLSEWIKKQNPTISYLWKMHFKYKDKGKLKVKGWRYAMGKK